MGSVAVGTNALEAQGGQEGRGEARQRPVCPRRPRRDGSGTGPAAAVGGPAEGRS
jgi:hypothetical protein